jgi:glycerophosphoryl diester phosphodiesterase
MSIQKLTILLMAVFLMQQASTARAASAPTAANAPARSPWNVHDHVPIEKIIVQAHRGAGELAEENTLEAFELGWKLGCIPESDLRTTTDGIIVAFHDPNFARVVKGVSKEMSKKGVKDITFAQLEKLDVGSWRGDQFKGHHVPRMTEVFALMKDKPERQLYMDIKNVDLKELAKEVKQYGVENRVILASPKYAILRKWRSLVPQGQTLYWMPGPEGHTNAEFDELRKNGFADVTQIQIHTHLVTDSKDITPASVNPFAESDQFLIDKGKEIRAHGILFQTLPYGGSTPGVYAKLLDLGLMSFATDHPDVTWDAIRQYYAQKGK